MRPQRGSVVSFPFDNDYLTSAFVGQTGNTPRALEEKPNKRSESHRKPYPSSMPEQTLESVVPQMVQSQKQSSGKQKHDTNREGKRKNKNTKGLEQIRQAIHGDDEKVGGYVKDGAKSSWLSIVNEINSLKNKGINLLDFMHVKLGNGDKTAFWEDIWIEDFSVASVRKVTDDKSLPEVDSKTRWIKYVPIKVNVHAWKVKTDSLPTRFNVSRRGAKTSSHLFFSCCMARQTVRMITRWWDVPYGEVDSYEDWINWLCFLMM
nr:RNA-directed DNA polymerase, eukaryota [Tanacetum cinerariifolium]